MKKKILFSILGSILLLSNSLTAFAEDTENPSDVEGLVATALDGAVKVEWDAALDDVGVTGYVVYYGLSSVDEPGEEYDFNVDVGNVTEYTIPDLENGTLYYFSVIALDAAENESIAWAPEAQATPDGEAGSPEDGDTDAPQVSGAEAMNIEEVKVEFSEAVVLPDSDPNEAFFIENEDTFEPLEVLDAVMDEDDPTNKTVILTTVDQSVDGNYKLTVGVNIEDLAGNPISSGTSDTAIFTGSGEPKPSDDTVSPKLVNIESVDNTHILVNFDETIVLGTDPAENFQILAEDDATTTITVLGVELGNNSEGVSDAAALVTTSEQESRSYILLASGISDEAGNDINPAEASDIFQGFSVDGGDGDDDGDDGDDDGDDVAGDDDSGDDDADQAQDVANFLAGKIFDAGAYMVDLSWKIPDGQAVNILEQVIYMSQDQGATYTKRATLDPDATEYSVTDLTSGEYWFKVSQLDADGNETEGSITTLILPETGPGLIGLLLGSLGLGHWITRRRKRNAA